MLQKLLYSPASPLRQIFWRIPYKWQLKFILLVWEAQYRWRRRTWRWAGSYLSESRPNFGVGLTGLVSVVLPVYNQAQTLAASIHSVLQQSYPHLELIIVNDGSTDETAQLLERYIAQPKITVVNQAHQGLPAALNRGFQEARGEFLTWTSGDNLLHPEQVARMVNYLQTRPEVALVYADFELIDEEGRPVEDAAVVFMRGEAGTSIVRPKRESERLNIGFECVIGPCFLYRSFLHLLLGNYNLEMEGSEDYDYWIRINNFFKICHLGDDQLLYRYRLHPHRLSHRLKPQISQLRRWLMKREQQFQRRLAYPLIIGVDEPSAKLFAGLQPDQRALPVLSFVPLNQPIASFDAVCLHSSAITSRLFRQLKQTLPPIICWLAPGDPVPELITQMDLVASLENSTLISGNTLFASTPEDIYHLLRIFVTARIDLGRNN